MLISTIAYNIIMLLNYQIIINTTYIKTPIIHRLPASVRQSSVCPFITCQRNHHQNNINMLCLLYVYYTYYTSSYESRCNEKMVSLIIWLPSYWLMISQETQRHQPHKKDIIQKQTVHGIYMNIWLDHRVRVLVQLDMNDAMLWSVLRCCISSTTRDVRVLNEGNNLCAPSGVTSNERR